MAIKITIPKFTDEQFAAIKAKVKEIQSKAFNAVAKNLYDLPPFQFTVYHDLGPKVMTPSALEHVQWPTEAARMIAAMYEEIPLTFDVRKAERIGDRCVRRLLSTHPQPVRE